MNFNKTGKLIRRNFHLSNVKIENVRSCKYLGLVFTPSGEIKSALDDLTTKPLKAYCVLKHKLGFWFYTPKRDYKTIRFTSVSTFWVSIKPQ